MDYAAPKFIPPHKQCFDQQVVTPFIQSVCTTVSYHLYYCISKQAGKPQDEKDTYYNNTVDSVCTVDEVHE